MALIPGPTRSRSSACRDRFTRGEIVDTITSDFFETATTLARSGNTLVAANAQFQPPPIDAAPEVVLLRR